MMVAPVLGHVQTTLRVNRPPELAAPDHQCLIEHPALLEVGDQRGGRLVHITALQRQIARQVAVLIPAAMVQLDEAHAALGQAPGQQTIRRVRARLTRVRAVQIKNVFRLTRRVHQLRHRGLHAVRHLRLLNARQDFRIAQPLVMLPV